jgi:hypothetical protein
MTARQVKALTSDIADVRALVADLAAESARIAVAVAEFRAHLDLVELIKVIHEDGARIGRAEVDPLSAEARAQKARAQFKAIPGGAL